MFRLWFKDAQTESSFADGAAGEFEYLDKTRYGSPYLPIMVIATALRTAATKHNEDDVPELDGQQFKSFISATIRVANPGSLKAIAKHYEGSAEVSQEEVKGRYFKVTVTASTLFEALNIMQVICILQAMSDKETYVRMDKGSVEKYLNCLNNANAPYYVRYLFASRAIGVRDFFNKMLGQIQGPDELGIQMNFGNTRQQRFDAISKVLRRGGTLVDIGCGEMFYDLRLKSDFSEILAVDSDEELFEANNGKVRVRQIENITPVLAKTDPAWVEDNLGLIEGSTVLMTEVLEHMPREDALKLLLAVSRASPAQIVITVPNRDFNVNYAFEPGQMRHSDHHYEPDEMMFEFLLDAARSNGYVGTTTHIGDIVKGQGASLMAVLTKPETKEAA
jgi:2-polyprenyl-3-methyl-5-hydroxy-6-metoxy-1,4-benzoquinol methylase